MSWIHRDDLVGMIQWLLERDQAGGAYNGTAPTPVTNRNFARTLGAAFGLVRGAILLMAVAVVVNMSPAHSAVWWTESKGAGVSLAALKGLKPVLPERFGQYLPG